MNVLPGEKLARFIRYGDHFRVATNKVRHEAFLPHKNSMDLSVYRISGLSEIDVWTIGRKYVQGKEKSIKSRADISASTVYENNLEIVPDEQGHERHANITPFPIANSLADKKMRRTIASKLALASVLVIMPTE